MLSNDRQECHPFFEDIRTECKEKLVNDPNSARLSRSLNLEKCLQPFNGDHNAEDAKSQYLGYYEQVSRHADQVCKCARARSEALKNDTCRSIYRRDQNLDEHEYESTEWNNICEQCLQKKVNIERNAPNTIFNNQTFSQYANKISKRRERRQRLRAQKISEGRSKRPQELPSYPSLYGPQTQTRVADRAQSINIPLLLESSEKKPRTTKKERKRQKKLEEQRLMDTLDKMARLNIEERERTKNEEQKFNKELLKSIVQLNLKFKLYFDKLKRADEEYKDININTDTVNILLSLTQRSKLDVGIIDFDYKDLLNLCKESLELPNVDEIPDEIKKTKIFNVYEKNLKRCGEILSFSKYFLKMLTYDITITNYQGVKNTDDPKMTNMFWSVRKLLSDYISIMYENVFPVSKVNNPLKILSSLYRAINVAFDNITFWKNFAVSFDSTQMKIVEQTYSDLKILHKMIDSIEHSLTTKFPLYVIQVKKSFSNLDDRKKRIRHFKKLINKDINKVVSNIADTEDKIAQYVLYIVHKLVNQYLSNIINTI